MDEQTLGAPSSDNQTPVDHALDHQRFNEWLTAAKTSDDIRNRIAVSGGTVSRGVFGKLYLMVPSGPIIAAVDQCIRDSRAPAANDAIYEQRQASNQ